jgi:hypothetical protein
MFIAREAYPSISKTNLAFNYCALKIQGQEVVEVDLAA